MTAVARSSRGNESEGRAEHESIAECEASGDTHLRRFRPYPAHKGSGVGWLGEIPVHWEVKRLRFLASINPSPTELKSTSASVEVSFVRMEALGEWGGLNLETTKHLGEVSSGYTYFRNGDVLVAKITPCFENGKGAAAGNLENGIGFGTTELHVLRPGPALTPSFLAYLSFSQPFRDFGQIEMKGVAGQQRVPENFVKDFRVALPPHSEQHVIGTFLDRETAKIDALVAKKERLIELLQEKRTALITRAVTRGLHPNAPMKDSGVEWLGEIPAHWTIVRLKHRATRVTSGSRGWAAHYSDDGPLFLRIGNLAPGSIDLSLHDVQRVSPPSGAEVLRTQVHAGDILLSITAMIGGVAVAPDDITVAFVNQHLALVRLQRIGDIEPRWVAYCILSRVGQEQLLSMLYGGTKDGLGLEEIRELILLMPPLAEQKRTVILLDNRLRRIATLLAKVREGVDRLKEFRTALISAAVTGKIDVREEMPAKNG